MSGELIRREAFSPERRRHNREERAAMDTVRFDTELERFRLAGRAQLADDKGELAVALANRAAMRSANSLKEMELLLRLSPDNTALAMDFAELRTIAHHIQKTALLEFGQP